jgi:hypothetical protein
LFAADHELFYVPGFRSVLTLGWARISSGFLIKRREAGHALSGVATGARRISGRAMLSSGFHRNDAKPGTR